MQSKDLFVFGYGSLMNKESLARTVPGERRIESMRLRGYQRKMNARSGDYLYMNLIPNPDASVEGVVIEVTSEEFELLREREIGYDAIDVTLDLEGDAPGTVVAFIAEDKHHPERKILRSYFETCFRDIPEPHRSLWIEEMIIENEIHEDTERPEYGNRAL